MPWMKEQLSETVGINAELNQPISKIIFEYLNYLKFKILTKYRLVNGNLRYLFKIQYVTT